MREGIGVTVEVVAARDDSEQFWAALDLLLAGSG